MKKLITVLLLMCFVLITHAQDFVYTAKNPAFGGNPYNYSWLMSSAQAQDTYEAPASEAYSYSSRSSNPVDDFAESLNRQILSLLSREIVSKQFGEAGLEEGIYVMGDYQIEIGYTGSGIVITIIDGTTGSTTNVTVPYF